MLSFLLLALIASGPPLTAEIIREGAQLTLDYQRLRGRMLEVEPAQRAELLDAFSAKYAGTLFIAELVAVGDARKAPTTAVLPDLLANTMAACEALDDLSCARLGRFYQRGAWPLPDQQPLVAFKYLTLACLGRADLACLWLGDIEEALHLDGHTGDNKAYEGSCRKKIVEGCVRRAARGTDLASWRQQACDLGDAPSCNAIAAEKAQIAAQREHEWQDSVQRKLTRRKIGIGGAIAAVLFGAGSLTTFVLSNSVVHEIQTAPQKTGADVTAKIDNANGLRSASLGLVIAAGVVAAVSIPLIATSFGEDATLQVSTNGSSISVTGTF